MVLAVGSEFAGYTIEALVGVGGTGSVYVARHPRLKRRVALKVLDESLGRDPGARARFDRETAVIARLEHPNIVAVYDRSSPADSTLWLAMRFAAGGDVATLIQATGGLPAQRALRLLSDAARGLDFAHRHGVLHRDVKPANLLIDRVGGDEQVLVADFGIARTLDDTATLSAVTASLAYAAPERFQHDVVDQRADVYSLGATFYEMLTGQAPFPFPDQAAVINAHLSQSPPRPSAARPGLPPGLDDVIATAMAKSPADRYHDCSELVADAERILTAAHRTTTVNPRKQSHHAPRQKPKHPTSTSASTPKFLRARGLTVAIGFVIVLVIALAVTALKGHDSAPVATTASAQPLDTPTAGTNTSTAISVLSEDLRHVAVSVLNATATPGAAAIVGNQLRAAGWNVVENGNLHSTDGSEVTTVCYDSSPGSQQAARQIGEQLGAPVAQRFAALAGRTAGVIVIVR
ncbi:protein kinase domain-containing protein [Nocardia sp. NPDC004722]